MSSSKPGKAMAVSLGHRRRVRAPDLETPKRTVLDGFRPIGWWQSGRKRSQSSNARVRPLLGWWPRRQRGTYVFRRRHRYWRATAARLRPRELRHFALLRLKVRNKGDRKPLDR